MPRVVVDCSDFYQLQQHQRQADGTATPTEVRIIATATKAGNGTNIALRVATLAAKLKLLLRGIG